VNKGKNFPSFQMLSACLVIGKFCVRFTASGARVMVKASCLLKSTLYN
jgi:hypothetical protein